MNTKAHTQETDCRSETGVTVGIVDSVITLCRLFRNRNTLVPAVTHALADLANDEDFAFLLSEAKLAERALRDGDIEQDT